MEETERRTSTDGLPNDLQNQTERSLVEMGFGVGGQLPPIPFATDLPEPDCVSGESISTLRISLCWYGSLRRNVENSVYNQFDLSALIEPVGDLGLI